MRRVGSAPLEANSKPRSSASFSRKGTIGTMTCTPNRLSGLRCDSVPYFRSPRATARAGHTARVPSAADCPQRAPGTRPSRPAAATAAGCGTMTARRWTPSWPARPRAAHGPRGTNGAAKVSVRLRHEVTKKSPLPAGRWHVRYAAPRRLASFCASGSPKAKAFELHLPHAFRRLPAWCVCARPAVGAAREGRLGAAGTRRPDVHRRRSSRFRATSLDDVAAW